MSWNDYVLQLQYDGTDLYGFQRQRNVRRTVQCFLEEALVTLYQERLRVRAAGRTDAGVHARCQTVSFRGPERIPPRRMPAAFNGLLPRDVAVTGADRAAPGFHPRRHAREKTYRYTLDTGPFRDVFWRRFAWFVPRDLDRDAMAEACRYLQGRRDFASFQAAGSSVKTTVRHLRRLEWDFSQEPLLHLYAAADGFLYKMVRALAGTLVEVGRGKRTPESLAALLEARDRRQAGPSAPPHGLCLWEIDYSPEWFAGEGSGFPAFLDRHETAY